jgi:uncharacterized protein YbcI
MPGFVYRHRLSGADATVETLPFTAELLSEGDLLNLVDGQVGLGMSADATLLGVALETRRRDGEVLDIRVTTDADAVYEVTDAPVRAADDALGLTGATGAQGVADSLNHDLTVVAASAAGAPTLVRIATGRHARGTPAGGRLNAAIARAVVQIHHDTVGRGPTKAQAFYRHDVVVVVLRDVLTRAEHSLAEGGREKTVMELRREFHESMRPALVAAVERLTGCKVVSFLSDNDVDPDVAVEVFVLDRPVPDEQPARPAT